MPNFISEDTIEKAILERLREQFGFELLNCHTSDADDLSDRSGRSDKREVIFAERNSRGSIHNSNGDRLVAVVVSVGWQRGLASKLIRRLEGHCLLVDYCC